MNAIQDNRGKVNKAHGMAGFDSVGSNFILTGHKFGFGFNLTEIKEDTFYIKNILEAKNIKDFPEILKEIKKITETIKDKLYWEITLGKLYKLLEVK